MQYCNTCCASFSRKQTYEKHILSLKHVNRNQENKRVIFACACGKSYTYREGLSRHRSVCTSKPNDQLIQYYEEKLESIQKEIKAIGKEKEAQIEVLKEQIKELILVQNHIVVK